MKKESLNAAFLLIWWVGMWALESKWKTRVTAAEREKVGVDLC